MKQNLRTSLKEIRRNIIGLVRQEYEEIVCKKFIERFSHVNSFGLYYPIQTELNPMPLVDRLFESNKLICLPIIKGEDMRFAKFNKEVIQGKFSPEPVHTNEIIVPELIVTPLLGYNHRGHRIGYGCGYYDKYFALNPGIIKVGIAFSAQQVECEFTEQHDEHLNFIITEKGIIEVKSEN